MVLRIGTLGAAAITPSALIEPAARRDDVEVRCVAARDRARAQAFAETHGIPTVHDGYADVVEDPEIDAVYNPLQISGHKEWTIRALEAGKHVLCEKPFAMNEAEAREMADAARRSGRVCVEAFHYYYHPVGRRMREIVQSGALERSAPPAHTSRSGSRTRPARSATGSNSAAARRWTWAATRCTSCATSSGPSPKCSRPARRRCAGRSTSAWRPTCGSPETCPPTSAPA